MKAFFEKLDLYKVIIVLCLVAMPVLGYFVWKMDQNLKAARSALAQATLQGRGTQSGDIEAIGTLMSQINKMKEVSKTEAGGDSHRVAFQRAIQNTQASGLKLDDFTIGDIKNTGLTLDNRRQATQQSFSIDFKRDGSRLPLSREFVNAMLFNCEKDGAWKLSQFRMRNKDTMTSGTTKTPPPEIGDEWFIETLTFARKVPSTK